MNLFFASLIVNSRLTFFFIALLLLFSNFSFIIVINQLSISIFIYTY